jgi:predicted metal-dependent HD superfamily phosphohydrolase
MQSHRALLGELIARLGGNPEDAPENIESRLAFPKGGGWAFDYIIEFYNESHRHYHNLRHIEWCHDLLYEMNPQQTGWRDTTELALWFHDVYYDPKRKDNEERSADILRAVGAVTGLERTYVDRVADIIVKTHHVAGTHAGDMETQWTLDIDLASLGFEAREFNRNSEEIRQEYAWVPEELYVAGRKAVLQGFLDRPFIYYTPECRDRFEKQARRNLQRAIEKLG